MRTVTAVLVALAVSPAAAQPVTSPSASCEVRFVRTPDDVRHVIESWLAVEPRCTTSIDLRVVLTEDGYYLLAQRDDGRIHERVVPDAQSAGVLVASWVADDWVEPPPPPSPPVAPRPLIVDPFDGQPVHGIAAHAAATTPQAGRWLSLAGMIRAGGAGGGGIRAELDLIRRGAWTLGAALSASESTDPTYATGGPAYFGTKDLKAIAFLARTSTFGRWELRIAAGAGVLHTESGLVAYSYSGPDSPDGAVEGVNVVSPAAEASATLSRRLGARWAITAGPVATFMRQEILTLDPYSWDPKMTIATRSGELMFVAGMRYSL